MLYFFLEPLLPFLFAWLSFKGAYFRKPSLATLDR